MGGGYSHNNGMKCRNQMSMIRLIHNVASDLKVNVCLDGKVRARDVKYMDVSDYLEIRPGMHHIKIYNAETGDVIKQLCAGVKTCSSKAYTLIITGKIDDLTSLKLLPIEDAVDKPQDGKTMVRFIHAASGSVEDGVDIWYRMVNVQGGTQGDDIKLFDNFKYTQASMYKDIDPGTLSLIISPTGSLDGIGPINVDIEANKNYTFIATGIEGDEKYPVDIIDTTDKSMCICLY